MPSIRELFSDPELMEEGEDAEIDIDKVLDSVTDILNDRKTEAPSETDTEPEDSPPPIETEEPEASSSAEPDLGGDSEVEDEPVPPPAPSAPDPLLQLPPERRAALLALDQAIMSDESKRAQVFGILSGQAEPQRPTLPEHIDPDSFEAQIWREQQEIKQAVQGMSQHQRDQQLAFEKQQANTAAYQAGDLFAQKYTGKLSQQDVIEIAKYAGESGIAAGFANTPEGRRNPAAALGQALESVLWSNEAFRAKVIDAKPVEVPGEKPEAVDRKRKLNALGTAASPVSGPSPKRPPAETGADGRLTEKSRQDLVKELATGIARQSEGSY